ncbi:STE3-domain-containing protein [Peniophora sp. CONT]|nr:STE3-domain-containing protein [Peniophora sp. CONT]
MAAVDPTYPLYPIACFLAAVLLLLVFFTSFVRQSWNLGIAFLCFWLIVENLATGINAVIWADNADLKLFVYCDIVTHLQLITSIVKPMATLIITRRLYLIASLHAVEVSRDTAERRNLAIEWVLGLVIPVLVAGPLYYVVQESRFQVLEGFGCTNAEDGSILNILLTWWWTVVPPLLSVTIYYPRVVRIFFQQNRDTNRFLSSDHSVSRTNYIRILALASIDVLLTLPIGIVSITLFMLESRSVDPLSFYPGWTYDHADWEPVGYSYAESVGQGTSSIAQQYFVQWTSPVLAFVIFGLFGVTLEARASYWRAICTLGGWFGWKPTPRARRTRSTLGDIEFGDRTQDGSKELETGLRSPDSINPDIRLQERGAGSELEGERAASELE